MLERPVTDRRTVPGWAGVGDGDLQGHEKSGGLKEQSGGQVRTREQRQNPVLELVLLIGSRLPEQAPGEAAPQSSGTSRTGPGSESRGRTRSAV